MQLLKFYKIDCKPCKMFTSVANRVAQENHIPLTEIDIGQFTELADHYEVDEVPTLILVLDDGREVARHAGMNTQRTVEANLHLTENDDML